MRKAPSKLRPATIWLTEDAWAQLMDAAQRAERMRGRSVSISSIVRDLVARWAKESKEGKGP